MPHICSISLVLICLLALGLQPCYASPAEGSTANAKLTEAHGQVYKRGFRDWEAHLWDDPQPANLGDLLQEGSQLGTGDKSWAQVTWPHLTTRAWSNSVYAIAPNRRLVYLTSGEMLYHLDKNRKDQSAYVVWTKFLSARIRGTTVLFQADDTSSRITVLEGCVDVTNRFDRSRIRLKPGVVYEVKSNHDGAGHAINSTSADTAAGYLSLSQLTPPESKPVTVFQTSKTISSLVPIDANAITQHPLITSFTSPLTSLPLVQKSMSMVTGVVGQTLSSVSEQKLLKGAVEILSVPTAMDYKVERATVALLGLPHGAVDFFPPVGLTGVQSVPTVPGQAPVINSPIAGLSSITSSTAALSGLTAGVSTANVLPSSLAGPMASGAITSLSTGVSTVTAGVLGGTAGGSLGGTAGVLGGATGALGGTISGALGGVSGVLGGTSGALGGLLGH